MPIDVTLILPGLGREPIKERQLNSPDLSYEPVKYVEIAPFELLRREREGSYRLRQSEILRGGMPIYHEGWMKLGGSRKIACIPHSVVCCPQAIDQARTRGESGIASSGLLLDNLNTLVQKPCLRSIVRHRSSPLRRLGLSAFARIGNVIQALVSRHDLTDFEWRLIEPPLPNKPRGVPRVNDRRAERHFLGAALRGARWRDLPERYGPRATCYNRFVRWRKARVWERMIDAITAAHDGAIQMIDSTSIRAHQQAASTKRRIEIIVAVAPEASL